MIDVHGLMKKEYARETTGGLLLVCLASVCTQLDKTWAWVVALALIVLILKVISLHAGGEGADAISAEAWFRDLRTLLKDSSNAHIYLKSFKHPDDFQGEHRKALQQIMDCFVDKLKSNSDSFRIVALVDSGSFMHKDPCDWLKTELIRLNVSESDADQLIKKCIKKIDSQPTTNATTFYVIDGHLLYYHVDSATTKQYHSVALSRSLIPVLIEIGLRHEFKI
jgi:hypothetical protein